VPEAAAAGGGSSGGAKADLSSLTSMLQARWKGATTAAPQVEGLRVGQIRSFRIAKLDPERESIELELA
jgi:small subunit ribosomal protein S1